MEYILIAMLTCFTYDDGMAAISQEFKTRNGCIAAGDVLMRKHKTSGIRRPVSYYICVPKG